MNLAEKGYYIYVVINRNNVFDHGRAYQSERRAYSVAEQNNKSVVDLKDRCVVERLWYFPIVQRGVDGAGKYQTAKEIEQAVARFFNARMNLPVARIKDGLGIHECDVLILTKAGYGIEVEIKVSKQDILNEQKKKHNHHSDKIKKLYFAIPKKLQKYMDSIPHKAGVITVAEGGYCRIERVAEVNEDAKPWSPSDIYQHARLGALRYWR